MEVISLKNVWLGYRVEYKESGKVSKEMFWALRDVSFDMHRGEAVGIIGENGAGKTTLLKLISGMFKPDKGKIDVKGSVSTLMEIGAGFQSELTGKENVYLTASLFGLTKSQIDVRYEDIIRFAEVGRFINASVRNYSQGMSLRLAFAIAIHVDPDILLVDDAFMVGDLYAQRKCIDKLFQLKEMGKTILFIMHDLAMVKRLCARGIFLREGRLIKDGPIESVCNYYTETIGDKGGIVCRQDGDLGIVVNNGRLILRWHDRTLTPYPAGYVKLISKGRQYLSMTARWEVQPSPEDSSTVVVTGKWPDLPLVQIWKITVSSENRFLWEVIIQCAAPTPIEKIEITAIFVDEYKRWMTNTGEGAFPMISPHPVEWEDVRTENVRDEAVGFSAEEKVGKVPLAILWERVDDGPEMMCHICNRGSELKGRGVLYEYFPQDHFLEQKTIFKGNISVFSQGERVKLDRYLRARKTNQDFLSIKKGPLCLVWSGFLLRLYWQDILCTAGAGFNTVFRSDGIHYDIEGSPEHVIWNAQKEDETTLRITVSWRNLPGVAQVWRFYLESEEDLIWEVTMQSETSLSIKEEIAEVILSHEYREWFSETQRGDFKNLTGGNRSSVILDKYVDTFIGVGGTEAGKYLRMPNVTFLCDDAALCAAYIYTYRGTEPKVKLQYIGIDFPDAQVGGYRFFRGKLHVSSRAGTPVFRKENISSHNPEQAKQDVSAEVGRLRFALASGKGKIFWNGIECTKGLGFYTSFFIRGFWNDSSHARWQVRSENDNRIEAQGYWPRLSLRQIWEIHVVDEHSILWKVRSMVWDTREGTAEVEREQVNIMLSDKYKEWFAPGGTYKRFPDRFNHHDGKRWDQLWSGDASARIGVKKVKMRSGLLERQYIPAVTLHCYSHDGGYETLVENADDLFQARILQCQSPLFPRELSGRERCIEGCINIAP